MSEMPGFSYDGGAKNRPTLLDYVPSSERERLGQFGDPLVHDEMEILLGFTRALSRGGLAIDPKRTANFLQALATLDVSSPRDTYWAGRLTLTAQADDLPIYDVIFAEYFSGRLSHRRPAAPPQVTVTTYQLPVTDDEAGADDADGDDMPVVRAQASTKETLRQRDMARLSPDERVELAAMIGLLRIGLPTRKGRRHTPHLTGRIDRRRMVRAMLATGGEPARPPRQRRIRSPRRVVLLIDVSGSMAPYADPLLRFAHVLVRHRPRATEAFTIGTRLSRVTRALAGRDPDVALQAASDVIPDFSGGTRLGEVIKAFNDRWGQRGMAHGAVVIVFSDGWERGSCDLLADQMARLSRLARRVVWVNPHKGRSGYLPVQAGIVAALPHVDHFVAGHSLATLEELLEVIRHA